MVNMLTRTHIADLFELSKTKENALAKSENETIEHKESSSFDAQIMKTCASFANNRGGYIIFGIKDKSRELVGLDEGRLARFDQYDLATVTGQLNDVFEPNIRIDKCTYTLSGINFGILYTYESEDKPVIATKNKGKIKNGDIYYSYGASRSKIKYAELRIILEERERQKLIKFSKHVEMIAKFGVDNTAIMNTENGDVIGPKIKRFVIDKELLGELRFIKEGAFKEATGKPTLKLIGELAAISDEVVQHLLIDKDKIFRVFLNQNSVANPLNFIEASCKQQVIYTPIYYYAHCAQFNKERLINFISDVQNPRNDTVEKLLARVANEDKLPEKLVESDSEAYKYRVQFKEYLINKETDFFNDDKIKYILFAIRTLGLNEIDKSYIFELLIKIYDRKSDLKSSDLANLRKAICYIDYLLYPLDE